MDWHVALRACKWHVGHDGESQKIHVGRFFVHAACRLSNRIFFSVVVMCNNLYNSLSDACGSEHSTAFLSGVE